MATLDFLPSNYGDFGGFFPRKSFVPLALGFFGLPRCKIFSLAKTLVLRICNTGGFLETIYEKRIMNLHIQLVFYGNSFVTYLLYFSLHICCIHVRNIHFRCAINISLLHIRYIVVCEDINMI